MLITRYKYMNLLDFKRINDSVRLKHFNNVHMLYGNIFLKKFDIDIDNMNLFQDFKFKNLFGIHDLEKQHTSSVYGTVIVVGLGGTGTCFLSAIDDIITFPSQNYFKQDYYFYEPDIVEPNNLERQIFSPELIYQPKLTCLLNFGFENQNVFMKQKRFTKEEFYNNIDQYRGDIIILGFTDSIQFRREIIELLDEIDINNYSNIESITYIDSGNSITSGQVIKSVISKKSKLIPESIRRLCMQEETTTLSCAEIEQTFFANLFASLGAHILLLYQNITEIWFDYQNLANNYVTKDNKQYYIFNFNNIFEKTIQKSKKWEPPVIDLETNNMIQGDEFEYLKEIANINNINDFIEFTLYFKKQAER